MAVRQADGGGAACRSRNQLLASVTWTLRLVHPTAARILQPEHHAALYNTANHRMDGLGVIRLQQLENGHKSKLCLLQLRAMTWNRLEAK